MRFEVWTLEMLEDEIREETSQTKKRTNLELSVAVSKRMSTLETLIISFCMVLGNGLYQPVTG